MCFVTEESLPARATLAFPLKALPSRSCKKDDVKFETHVIQSSPRDEVAAQRCYDPFLEWELDTTNPLRNAHDLTPDSGQHQKMDSTTKDSYLGSFYQPPNKISSVPHFYKEMDACNLKTESHRPASVAFNFDPPPNSKELLAALKTLQEKIRRVEMERSQAEDNMQSLSKEAAEYKKVLTCENQGKGLTRHVVTEQSQEEVISQLSNAQGRCTLLEKQLDYMRTLVRNAEKEKNVLEKQTDLRVANDLDQAGLNSKLERLNILENECLRLTATQRTAQNKIHQLQEKLHEEEHHRKLLQEKSAQIESGLAINRILMPTAVSSKIGPKKKAKKKCSGKKNVILKEPVRQQVLPKAGELPFVAGTSISTSHSLSANVQTVLHMMKHQSPRACPPCPGAVRQRPSRSAPISRPISSCSTAASTGESLSDLLLALQEELGQMSMEHHELLKLIQDTENTDLREDLEREMDCLIKQMESKGEQILKLKKHQASVKKLKLRAEKAKRSLAKQKTERQNGTKPSVTLKGREVVDGRSAVEGPSSLQLLKNVKKLQMTLKKEDIMWEK
ncbi:centrosomal protein CEP57L1 [Ambystoma mexicanum]|uniref:centrosomal protein CEP57L1 n=1 Tax=Ambystoma mexicanum TaxID=8296 RepID=UPI0037E94521